MHTHITLEERAIQKIYTREWWKVLSPSRKSARGVMVIVVGNGHADTSSNLDKTDCISHSTNTLGKGMNPIILPLAMGK